MAPEFFPGTLGSIREYTLGGHHKQTHSHLETSVASPPSMALGAGKKPEETSVNTGRTMWSSMKTRAQGRTGDPGAAER